MGTEAEQITPRVKPKVLFEGEGDVIANDQITAMFDETVARNKRLESEITILYRRVRFNFPSAGGIADLVCSFFTSA